MAKIKFLVLIFCILFSAVLIADDDFSFLEGVYVRDYPDEYNAFKPEMLIIQNISGNQYLFLHAAPFDKDSYSDYDIVVFKGNRSQVNYETSLFDKNWVMKLMDNEDTLIIEEENDPSGEVPPAIYVRFGEKHLKAYEDLVGRVEDSR